MIIKLYTVVVARSAARSSHRSASADETVYCGGGTIGDEFETMTTAKAQELGKSPCQMCKRILEE
jgi:methionyl-tRNA synthetase